MFGEINTLLYTFIQGGINKHSIDGQKDNRRIYTCMQICPPLLKITQVPVEFDITI